MKQKTLKNEIRLSGKGIHSDLPVEVSVKPAPVDHGIVFQRVDAEHEGEVHANVRYIAKEDFLRQSALNNNGVSVKTPEHLLATLSALGVTNAVIEMNQEELPALDGGAQQYCEAIRSVGLQEQEAEQPIFEVKEPIYVDGHNGSSIVILPYDKFRISYTLSYGSPDLSDQFFDVVVDEESFVKELAGARTFCLKEEALLLKKAGFGKGANYQNTLVFENNKPIENELRYPDEAVRHKIVDLVGDLSLLGVRLKGHVVACKSGHSQNMSLIRALSDVMNKKVKRHISHEGASEVITDQVLDSVQIQKILPHRYPFLFVDRVLELEPCKRAVAIKNVSLNENFFQGHFPGHPIMPGVLIVEAMAQVAGIIMLNTPENWGKLAYFMSIDKAKFRHPVTPGDELRFEVKVLKAKAKYGQCEGRAFVKDKLVCQAELKFSLLGKKS